VTDKHKRGKGWEERGETGREREGIEKRGGEDPLDLLSRKIS